MSLESMWCQGLLLLLCTYQAHAWMSECGESKYTDAGIDGPRLDGDDKYIVNGWDARPHEFPWQASLKRLTSLMCGAVIINERWLLTAAHCTEGEIAASLRIIIGGHIRSNHTNVRQEMFVEAYINHEDYDQDGEIENDIAVIYLTEDITMTEDIQPACRPTGESYEDMGGTTSGWGAIFTGGPLADVLQYANQNIMDDFSCWDCFPSATDIYPGMLCFGVCSMNEQSTCNGDSGGPLVVRSEADDTKFEIVGLTSWGMGGCLSIYPPVFTNVSYFVEWVDDHISEPPSLATLY